MSYDDLSVRINNGDKAALREFLSDAGREIYDIAMAELKDKDKAMEVVRVVFSRINDSAKSGECPSELSSWIVRLTLEQCLIAQDASMDTAPVIEEDAPAEQEHEPVEERAYEKVSGESDADATLEVLTDETVSSGENEKNKAERKNLRKKEPKKAWDIIVIVILSILTLFMAWTVFVMLITNQLISDITQGIAYDYAAWFNQNIFRLF